MAYGMTAEEYWRGNPYLAVAYREAYKLKAEIKNNDAWLQGAYFADALDATAFNLMRKRSQAAAHYLEKPYDLSLTDNKSSEQPLTKEEATEQAIAGLNTLQANWDRKHGVIEVPNGR